MNTINLLDSQKQLTDFTDQFAKDVLTGFSTNHKSLSSKYFYDELGSDLFTQITNLEDYYPTNCEANVLIQNKMAIANLLKDIPFNLIELGAGDGRKTKILLEEFIEQNCDFKYFPIDISEAAVNGLCSDIKEQFPDLDCSGVVAQYEEGIDWISMKSLRVNVVLFLGSNIGNFTNEEAESFLRVLWKSLKHNDYLFIGFDLKKDIDVLHKAYNDSKGITKAFNLNLLDRINSELAGEFDKSKFYHHGFYNPSTGAMESYLVSKVEQEIKIGALSKKFKFKAFEAIHLEQSQKYLVEDINSLANSTGYNVLTNFTDSQKYFIDSMWEVCKL